MLRWALTAQLLVGLAVSASFEADEALQILGGAANGNVFMGQFQIQNYMNPSGALPLMNDGYGNMVNVTCLNPTLQNPTAGTANNGKCNYVFQTSLIVGGGVGVGIGGKYVHSSSNGNVAVNTFAGWNTTQSVSYPTKPRDLLVNVYHVGSTYQLPIPVGKAPTIISPPTGFMLMETFVVDMADVLPLSNSFSASGGFTTVQVQGQILNTTLQITYALRCLTGGVGPMCDIMCTPGSPATNPAKCTRTMYGVSAQLVCVPSTGVDANQYTNCTLCPNGVATNGNGAFCSGATPVGPSQMPQMLGVDPAYQTATTALAIVCVIAFIILLFLAFRMYMSKKKADEAEYVRRRNEWREKPNAELSSKDNRAFNHRPDPDATSNSDTTSQSGSETGSQTSASEKGSHVSHSNGSVAVSIPKHHEHHHEHHDKHHHDKSKDSSRRPSDTTSHDPSHQSEHGRTTPRIEARV